MTEAQIIEMVLDYIVSGDATEEAFNRRALEVFAYQFENNEFYRRFAVQRARTMRTVKNWRDIPAVPINAFKELTLSCRSAEEVERIFMTSGTTKEVRGRNYHPTLAVYDRSMTINFRHRFMEDRERIRMGILFPDEEAMPNSSLAHYLGLASRTFGAEGSGYFIGESGIETERLLREFARAEETGEPYALLGASYSFVHLIDDLDRLHRKFVLPEGSRVLDTGGFKGNSRELVPDEFYDRLTAVLGVPRSRCINMYGMTELSTQFYDWGNETTQSVKSGPHWIRSRLIDPLTGRDVPPGHVGVLVHYDLAQFNSVSAILTEDLGAECDGGFLLLGRAEGAYAKGCSMAVEEFFRAARG